MRLRNWQLECSDLAIEHYEKINKHFLCLATPGAGKTVMAAEVAIRLYEQGKIDFILCFSPSVEISQNIKKTLAQRFNANFDGLIGSIGGSYTYQSTLSIDAKFWQILNKNRVFVIFDEIHHCAGSTIENANAWGEEILEHVEYQATYTLALSGTPWRSDNLPIVLAKYYSDENRLKCDYKYGLKEAIGDNVCRKPKIVLVDNEKISTVDNNNETKVFNSFKALLSESVVSYQSIITNVDVMTYILKQGCNKLAYIRKQNPFAAGLVVASNIQHAQRILNLLQTQFNQSAVIVTHQQEQSQQIIENFRHSDHQWIVSVSMISEGTDIPRLQVCCHLSRVKTELYFRQVLGRVLRINNAQNQEAWLYTFAEPKLIEFASRIEQEVPEETVLIKDYYPEDTKYLPSANLKNNLCTNHVIELDDNFGFQKITLSNEYVGKESETNIKTINFDIIGKYREQVISTFSSPF